MTLKNNRTPLLTSFKLCASCDLQIWQMTLKNNKAPLLCYFKLFASFCSHLWFQTEVLVWKSPNWDKICFDLWYLDLWPLTVTFAGTSPLSLVTIPENCMMMRWKENSEKGVTNGRTSFSMKKPTTWCKCGRVSLASSNCLYKTQPERALAQVFHTSGHFY